MTSATDQSTIVLKNRRINTEREVGGFGTVCSSVAGMRFKSFRPKRNLSTDYADLRRLISNRLQEICVNLRNLRITSSRAENDEGSREKQSRARTLARRSSGSESRRRRRAYSRSENVHLRNGRTYLSLGRVGA